jgi:hypothetical protein
MKTLLKQLNTITKSQFVIIFVIIGLVVLFLTSFIYTVEANETNQTNSCPETTCSQPRKLGNQPWRYDLIPTFLQAANNQLGSNGPVYDLINRGNPPAQIAVSSSQPIPNILLRGMAWQESHWLQFGDTILDPDNVVNVCTLVGRDCGYGIMQETSCMKSTPGSSCAWVSQNRVSEELNYNMGVGVNTLIQKWNIMPTVGNDDHTVPDQWYFPVLAYNGWDPINGPNNSSFDPQRPPYGEGRFTTFTYPYQEKIWGTIAHPEINEASRRLWRPTRLPWTPRGIFGLRGQNDWRPPIETPSALISLLDNIHYANGIGPSIILQNSTGQTLAADVALYNSNHTFNRWWLGSVPPAHTFDYIRLNPHAIQTLPISQVFNSEDTFNGYARISASDGIVISMTYPANYLSSDLFPNRAFMPIITQANSSTCNNIISNGGFENIAEEVSVGWISFSSQNYILGDSTWFRTGHSGAYLGGYDNANDKLTQDISIPGNTTLSLLTFDWYIQSLETTPAAYDFLNVQILDANNNLIATIHTLSNQDTRESWHTISIDLSGYIGQNIKLSFNATSDITAPTSFFVDNVILRICIP